MHFGDWLRVQQLAQECSGYQFHMMSFSKRHPAVQQRGYSLECQGQPGASSLLPAERKLNCIKFPILSLASGPLNSQHSLPMGPKNLSFYFQPKKKKKIMHNTHNPNFPLRVFVFVLFVFNFLKPSYIISLKGLGFQ